MLAVRHRLAETTKALSMASVNEAPQLLRVVRECGRALEGLGEVLG